MRGPRVPVARDRMEDQVRVRVSVCVAFMLALSMTSGCARRMNPETEWSNVKSTIDQFTRVFEAEDTSLFSRIMAHDPDMVTFGTDSVEHWVGWEKLKQGVQEQLAAVDSIKLTVTDQTIKIHSSGTVAWFSEFVDWDLKAGGQPVHIAGSRITGVLEKRDGNWVIVQFHASVPVSG